MSQKIDKLLQDRPNRKWLKKKEITTKISPTREKKKKKNPKKQKSKGLNQTRNFVFI